MNNFFFEFARVGTAAKNDLPGDSLDSLRESEQEHGKLQVAAVSVESTPLAVYLTGWYRLSRGIILNVTRHGRGCCQIWRSIMRDVTVVTR